MLSSTSKGEHSNPNLSETAFPELLVAGVDRLGIRLTHRQTAQFVRYYEELVAWNDRISLTTITGWEEVQVRHFLDSLTVVLAPEVSASETARVIDIGTGAGFPGLPLKIAFPHWNVTLVDSTTKKTAFLKHVISALDLVDVEVVAARSETIAHAPEHRESYDLAFGRAIAKLNVLAELALPLCRVGGAVIAHKSKDAGDEIDSAARAIELMGGKVASVRSVEVEQDRERLLVVLNKVRPTPAKYPRRPGMPAKRPL